MHADIVVKGRGGRAVVNQLGGLLNLNPNDPNDQYYQQLRQVINNLMEGGRRRVFHR